ncbi:MAG TPA: hypothetical protein VFS39_06675 [Nitrospira sp.]|nr:hypothetical protein [Nitrospira sp.]
MTRFASMLALAAFLTFGFGTVTTFAGDPTTGEQKEKKDQAGSKADPEQKDKKDMSGGKLDGEKKEEKKGN